jgi:hypothetical protein
MTLVAPAVVCGVFLAMEHLCSCAAHPTMAGGMPGVVVPIPDAPPRRSDGGQP